MPPLLRRSFGFSSTIGAQRSRLAHVIWWLLLFASATRAQTRPGCVNYPRGLAPFQTPRKAAGNSTSNAPASASSASASPALRALRQLRLSRRPTCPLQRKSSRRFHAIQSRPYPVKWRTRRVTPFGKAGASPQAASPPDRPARAPRRIGLNRLKSPAGPRQPAAPAAHVQQ
jgi:hypothetical protein